MASVRAQIFAAVEAKLQQVAVDLDWSGVIRNPREPLGEDDLNCIVMMDGGDRAPEGLTGFVEDRACEFSVGLMVRETDEATLEQLLDAGFVAVTDSLMDPTDIQLGGLIVGLSQGEVSDPVYGRPKDSARIVGGQTMDFTARYMGREGDASAVGP